jgi:hypothetical protein
MVQWGVPSNLSKPRLLHTSPRTPRAESAESPLPKDLRVQGHFIVGKAYRESCMRGSNCGSDAGWNLSASYLRDIGPGSYGLRLMSSLACCNMRMRG